MLFAFDATPEDTTMTTKHESIIERVEGSLSKSPELKQAGRSAKNMLDDVYGCFSHAGREINSALDGLPKNVQMSPTAKAVKEEFERNCESAGRLGNLLGHDFKTYGVPLIRDGVMEISKDEFLLGTVVVTAGCAAAAATTKNEILWGAAAAGVVTGGLYVVGKPAVKRVEEFTREFVEQLPKAN